ncbi:MAG: hypothetical protein ACI8PT_001267 [Gammaproteobacteria bacterium]|jgi:hypothetical protein
MLWARSITNSFEYKFALPRLAMVHWVKHAALGGEVFFSDPGVVSRWTMSSSP